MSESSESLQQQSTECSEKQIVKTFEKSIYFGKCKVCKDKATGIHYGIPSCEGCKSFFKRSIDKYNSYYCYFGYKCQMTPNQRKRCKYCRWICCLKAGMSFLGVKMGRIPKAIKEKVANGELVQYKEENDSENDLNDSNDSLSLTEMSQLIEASRNNLLQASRNKIIENNNLLIGTLKETVYRVFLEYRSDYDLLYEKALDLIKKGVKPVNDPSKMSNECLRNYVSMNVSDNANKLINYIKTLPGFENLNSKEQFTVMNKCFLTAHGFKEDKLFIDDEIYLMIGDLYSNRLVRRLVLGDNLADLEFKFHQIIKTLKLTDREISLIVPYMMSKPSLYESPFPSLDEIYKCYESIMLHEFNLNNRSADFIDKINQLIVLAFNLDDLAKIVIL